MTFHHSDEGTDESVWAEAIAAEHMIEADLTIDALFVVAAHPDDEALGVGGLMHRMAARGIPLVLFVITDGEGSHPGSTTITPTDLAERRRDELRAGMSLMAPDADIHFLGIPDGKIDENAAVLTSLLDAALRPFRAEHARPLVVAPWVGDRHRDHRIAGEVAMHVCRAVGIRFLAYPIWLWHWGGPSDIPWQDARFVALTEPDRAAKRAALDRHTSQVRPLSPLPGDETMLHERMRAHFDRPAEILFTAVAQTPAPAPADGSVPVEWFEKFYKRHDDPWGFDSRWYEERKRAVLLASLPDRRYDRALELGCATGLVTQSLATRSSQVLAVDAVDAALAQARERLAGVPNVEFRRALLPGDWPAGRYDLIVLSEIGYYFDAPDLEKVIARILGSLTKDGHLVACHWRHPVSNHPVTGDGVHVALRTQPGLVSSVRHEEDDFLLEVFARPPARSVAEREGLA
ncbi:bifunctional PIG-L family deacetylase/class I SAM-dependent methyltransferase [Planococcus sp. APC 4015]|nr:bifunctional PIG-L family deacetylase/class I SAM-dependent methyltransferase [Planococcus sp. APC 4015]